MSQVEATLVQNTGEYASRCGYCKSDEDSSVSHGVYSHALTVEHYQALVDRGWRRSGKFLYKPTMDQSCCPPYTIRLPVQRFLPTKEQRRVLRKMQRYLEGSLSEEESMPSYDDSNLESNEKPNLAPSVSDANNPEDSIISLLESFIDRSVCIFLESRNFPNSHGFATVKLKKGQKPVKEKLKLESNEELYTSSIAFSLSSFVKRQSSSNAESSNPNSFSTILKDTIKEFQLPENVSVLAQNGHVNFVVKTDGTGKPVEEMAERKKQNLRLAKPLNLSKSSVERRLTISTIRPKFIREEYELYKKYQTTVHNEDNDTVSESSYTRFLVDTPLSFRKNENWKRGDENGGKNGSELGSFHQQYRIDGKLIAVGVVDILPNCLSSKYLFWDPEFAFLSLGKFSALKEIEWVQNASKNDPNLAFYYLGYYIHSCPKMKYKAQYAPSYLLCPLRFQWFPYSEISKMFEKSKVVVFSRPPQPNAAQLTVLDCQSNGHDDAIGSNELQLTPPEEKELISQLKEGMKRMLFVIGRHAATLETLVGSGLLFGDSLKALEAEILEYGRKAGAKFMAEARYALSPDKLSFL